jgi:hypothetical protein
MSPERAKAPDEEAAHDVLAAEAFAVPAPDPSLRREPVVLPEDPSGIEQPHDILAADEFPMPAGPRRPRASGTAGAASARRKALRAVAHVLGLLGLGRRRD